MAAGGKFQLVAGHPVLDLVNTLDNRFAAQGPTELLGGYSDLLRFAHESRLIAAQQRGGLAVRENSRAARAALRSARELREALADLFYGNARLAGSGFTQERGAIALAVLQRHVRSAEAHRRLVRSHRSGADDPAIARFALEWAAPADRCELPVWILAERARDLLVSPAMENVHLCESATCRWLFLDTSKNHSRRWCDMKVCGNRMKARRYLARRAVGSRSGSD